MVGLALEHDNNLESIQNIFSIMARGARTSFLLRNAGIFLKFCYTLILTRFLGADLFGLYALGYAFYRILAKISTVGIDNALLKYVPAYSNESRRRDLKGVLVSAFIITSGVSIVVSFITLAAAPYLATVVFANSDLEYVFKVFALCIPLMAIVVFCSAAFQARKMVALSVSLREVLHVFIAVILSLPILYLRFSLKGILICFLISLMFTMIISLYFFKNKFSEYLRQELRYTSTYRNLLSFSLPVFLVGFSYILMMQTDRIMIGYFLDSKDVGIYVVAARMALLLNLVAASFQTIFVPYISELYNKNQLDILSKVIKVINKWTFVFSVIVWAFFVLFSGELLSIFGREFVAGAIPFVVLSSTLLLVGVTGSNAYILQMTGKQVVECLNSLVSVVGNVVLNVILIPRYGIVGSAVATGASLVFMNVVRLFQIYCFIGVTPYDRRFLKPLFSSTAAAVGAGLFLHFSGGNGFMYSALSFGIFVGIYVSLYVVSGLDDEEKYLRFMVGLVKTEELE
jgi:O-antigen/teichoic acid export membrane protein